jgi:hypothetical protein
MKVAFGFMAIMVVLQALPASAQNQEEFPPPLVTPVITAHPVTEAITVDGRLAEKAWNQAEIVKDFFRVEPRQGGAYQYPTFVKVLFDKQHLYFGAFCKDSLGKKGVRVQDLRRDFAYPENDVFAISLDPQNLKRYAMSFQTTPYGNQRDLQVFDGNLTDQDWDALWKVRTTVVDSGYVVEMAIPFKSLRYDYKKHPDSASFGLAMFRLARRDFEQTVFPAMPQAYQPYRMTYAARLTGLKLPPPAFNLRVQPYTLYQFNKNTDANQVKSQKGKLKAGGEVKWAINPHAVLDLTVNTDFAQADVDQAVNNLTRFNVFFPERRQFFLENSGVYAGANNALVKPFFSRSIGLESTQFNANPVNINAGARYTDKTQSRTLAGLYIHQQGSVNQAAANLSVLRYLKNYGEQNNIGLMFTGRFDEKNGDNGSASSNNTTFTLDGLNRYKDKLTINYLLTGSRDNASRNLGSAAYININYATNKMNWQWASNYVSEKYRPAMGFVYQNNVVKHNPGGYLIFRPKKLKWIRTYEPDLYFNYYHNATDGQFQQANINSSPVYIFFKDNSYLQSSVYLNWQRINFDFSVFDIPIAQKDYFYPRYLFTYRTDQSAKVAVGSTYEFGKFYNGNLNTLNATLRMAPLPHIAFTGTYEYNQAKKLGINQTSKEVHLFTAGLRLAYNPRLQLSGFYQFNSFDNQSRVNMRGSWEFAPLSFVYLVFNESSFRHSPVANQSVINKITFLKQF